MQSERRPWWCSAKGGNKKNLHRLLLALQIITMPTSEDQQEVVSNFLRSFRPVLLALSSPCCLSILTPKSDRIPMPVSHQFQWSYPSSCGIAEHTEGLAIGHNPPWNSFLEHPKTDWECDQCWSLALRTNQSSHLLEWMLKNSTNRSGYLNASFCSPQRRYHANDKSSPTKLNPSISVNPPSFTKLCQTLSSLSFPFTNPVGIVMALSTFWTVCKAA